MLDFLAYFILVVVGGFIILPAIGWSLSFRGDNQSYLGYVTEGLIFLITVISIIGFFALSFGSIFWAIDRLTK